MRVNECYVLNYYHLEVSIKLHTSMLLVDKATIRKL